MLVLYCYRLFFECYGDHRDLHVLTHSFPTRRSSDLQLLVEHLHQPRVAAAAHDPVVEVEVAAALEVAAAAADRLVAGMLAGHPLQPLQLSRIDADRGEPAGPARPALRPEERRGGKTWARPFNSWRSPTDKNKKKNNKPV